MGQVVFTVALGVEAAECALGLGRSLKLIGDETHRIVFTDQPEKPWQASFHEVRVADGKPSAIEEFWEHFRALWTNGFEQALYINPESLAFRRIGPIFDWCSGKRVAVAGKAGFWQQGLMYVEQGSDGTTLHDAPQIPPATQFYAGVEVLEGRLHLDVRTNTCRFVSRAKEARLYEPFIFANSSGQSVRAYRKQLKILAELEEYERTHGFGYMSPTHKLRRSIEKRILRVMGKL